MTGASTMINALKNRLHRHWTDTGIFIWPATQPINSKYQVLSKLSLLAGKLNYWVKMWRTV